MTSLMQEESKMFAEKLEPTSIAFATWAMSGRNRNAIPCAFRAYTCSDTNEAVAELLIHKTESGDLA
jgi:hypothetical protein